VNKDFFSSNECFYNNATSPLYAEIQQQQQENFNLRKSIGEIPKINSKLDDLEQHSRKSCVRISGVPESVGENTADIVCGDVAFLIHKCISCLSSLRRSSSIRFLTAIASRCTSSSVNKYLFSSNEYFTLNNIVGKVV
jgi:hypothetical protein